MNDHGGYDGYKSRGFIFAMTALVGCMALVGFEKLDSVHFAGIMATLLPSYLGFKSRTDTQRLNNPPQ